MCGLTASEKGMKGRLVPTMQCTQQKLGPQTLTDSPTLLDSRLWAWCGHLYHLQNIHASLSLKEISTDCHTKQMCHLSLSVAQERWRPLLQLHSSTHPLLREACSAHPSRIQYPSLCQCQKRLHISDFSVYSSRDL